MTDSLQTLREQLADPLPHPDPEEMHDHAAQAAAWLLHHFATLPDQEVGRPASRAEMERLLREPPPEQGQGFAQVLADFTEKVVPYAFRINHPRFLAFVPTAPTGPAILADLLCAGTSFFAGVWKEAAGPAQVELIVLDWFKDFLGYPPEAHGILTSGGSEANLTALVTAREPLSYPDRQHAVLYVSEQRHWSVDRAAKVIGLRPDQLRPVPVSAECRMEATALATAVADDRRSGRLPWAVVANAGATNNGSIDSLDALADFCATQRLWLHVDAAYGWSAVLVPEGRLALAGIGRADSITLDPHKWFGQPYEVGCLLVRDGQRLAHAFAIRPDYMQDVEPGHDEVNFCDHGLALTRRFRALKIWFSVKVLGLGWFRDLIERSCRLAEFAQGLMEEMPCFEVLSARQLSIVCFRHVPEGSRPTETELDRHNLSLAERLCATRRAFLSSTRLGGRVTLRLCFVNWRTTAADVEEVVNLLARLGSEC